MDDTTFERSSRTLTALAKVATAFAAVVSIASISSAVAIASRYEDPTRALSSSSLPSASRAARQRTCLISSRERVSNNASALRSFSARVFLSSSVSAPSAPRGSAETTIVATKRAAKCQAAEGKTENRTRFQHEKLNETETREQLIIPELGQMRSPRHAHSLEQSRFCRFRRRDGRGLRAERKPRGSHHDAHEDVQNQETGRDARPCQFSKLDRGFVQGQGQ